ncbi:putative nepenthesin [Dioscorea sansibarensis]
MGSNGGDPRRPPPQLHGVVIISLPPPDDPTKGKTITAFTLSDSDHPPPHHHGHLLTLPPPPPPQPPLPLPLSPRRVIAILFATSILILSLWVCLFSNAPYQLLRSMDEDGRRRNESSSFLFDLYPKLGNRSAGVMPDVKLGSFRMKSGKSSKLVSSSSKDTSAVFPLKGNVFPDGQYYTSVFVGNPPKPYFLDVDTGSDLTWIQCDAPCTSCAKGPHPLYQPTKGKIVPSRDLLCLEVQSNQNFGYCDSCQQCDYEIEYADRSSSMGVLARDDMHLISANNDLAKFNFAFGCAYDQQGQLLASPAKTDGILGLSSSKVSLPSQLASQGIINNVMGHCISNEADRGGYMFLGDDFVPRWGMTWVPNHSSRGNYYRAEVMKIKYGPQQLTLGAGSRNVGQVVFDTGSSYTYFTNEVYTGLLTTLKHIANGLVQDNSDSTLPLCWRADFPIRSVKDVKQFFEPLTLQFGKLWWMKSLTLTIPPESYLIISDKGYVCLGILDGSEINDGSTIILGDISLRGKLLVYDNVKQKIGWTQSDCAKPQKLKGFPFFF